MNSNYIEKIFGKIRTEVTLADIQEYFSTPQEESSVIEFKSGEVEIIDIYKEIAAFLNTEGGLLIIGAPRESKQNIGRTVVKICEGELTFSSFKNKDWLYQKIASNITPTPTDLKIEEFLTPNGNVFLIDTPQSLNPPHQCSADGRYYIRLERDSKPAPHGLVQALFNKRRVPNLIADFFLEKIDDNSDEIEIAFRNISNIPAEKLTFMIDLFNIEDVESKSNFEKNIDKETGCSRFTFSECSDRILVQIISVKINLKALHYGNDYVICVSYWCRDLDIQYQFYTYSPKQQKAINKGNDKGKDSVFDAVDNLKK